jgi:hypothetical protein
MSRILALMPSSREFGQAELDRGDDGVEVFADAGTRLVKALVRLRSAEVHQALR